MKPAADNVVPVIRLRGVSKSFVEADRRHLVLEDVDLDVLGQLIEGSVKKMHTLYK